MTNEFRVACYSDQDLFQVKVKGGLETAKAQLQEILDNYIVPVIINDDDKKAAKAKRTELNSLLKRLKDDRLTIVAQITGEYSDISKALEKMIEEKTKLFSKEIEAYEQAGKVCVTNEKITAKVTCFNKNQFDELVAFCQTKGIEIKEN